MLTLRPFRRPLGLAAVLVLIPPAAHAPTIRTPNFVGPPTRPRGGTRPHRPGRPRRDDPHPEFRRHRPERRDGPRVRPGRRVLPQAEGDRMARAGDGALAAALPIGDYRQDERPRWRDDLQ